jgi:hypothetical protein
MTPLALSISVDFHLVARVITYERRVSLLGVALFIFFYGFCGSFFHELANFSD